MSKLLTFVLIILSNTVLANPFEYFTGIYKSNTNPVIENRGMTNCNWMNLKNIQEAIISQNAVGTFELQIISIQSNSPLRVSHQLNEFKFTNEFGGINSGVLSGDINSAQYVLTNAAPGSSEKFTFSISKLQDGHFYLYIVEQFRDDNTTIQRNGACYYHINNLVKVR